MILRTLLETIAVIHAAGISHCSLHPDTIYIHSCGGVIDEHGATICGHDCDFDGKLHRGALGSNLFLQISNLEYCIDSGAMIGNDVTYVQKIHNRWHPYWSSPELCSLALKPRSKLRKKNFRDSSGKTDVWSVGMIAMSLIERNIRLNPQYCLSKDSSNGTSAQTLREHSVKQVSRFTANPRIGSLRKWTTLAQDFVHSCLRPGHADRPTAANAAKHPFLTTAQETILLPISDISESEASNLDDTYEDETTYIPAPDSDSLGGSSEASFWSEDETASRSTSQYVRSVNARSRGNSSSVEADMEVSSEGSTGSVKIIKQMSDEEPEFFPQPVSSVGPNPKFSSTRRRGKSEHLPETPVDPLDRPLRIENVSPPGRQGRVSPNDIHVRDGIQDGTGLKTNPMIAVHSHGHKPHLAGSLPVNNPMSSSLVSFPSDTPDSAKESGGRKTFADRVVTTPPPVRHIRARNAVVSSAPNSTTLERNPIGSGSGSGGGGGFSTPKEFSPLPSPSSSSASLNTKAIIRPRERSPSPVRKAPHPTVSETPRRSSLPLLPITDLARSPTTSASSTQLATPISAGSAGSSESNSTSSSRLSSYRSYTPLQPPHHLVVATPSATQSGMMSGSPGSSPGGGQDVSASSHYASSVSSHGSAYGDHEADSKSSKDSTPPGDVRTNGRVGITVHSPPSKASSLTDPLDRQPALTRSMRSRSNDTLFEKEIMPERKYSIASGDPIDRSNPNSNSNPSLPVTIHWTTGHAPQPLSSSTGKPMTKSPSTGAVPSISTSSVVASTTPPSSTKTTPRKKVKRTRSRSDEDEVPPAPPSFIDSSSGASSSVAPPPRATSPDARKLPSLDEALAKEIKEVETKWQSEIRKRVKSHESREKEWVDKWSSKTRNVKKRYDSQVAALAKREETRMAEFRRAVTDDKTRLFQEHQREFERDEPPTARRNSVTAYHVLHKHLHSSSEGGKSIGEKSPLSGSHSNSSPTGSSAASPSVAPSSPQTPHHLAHSGLISAREGKKTQFGKREVHLNHEKLIYEMDRKHCLERYDLELKLLDEADAIDRDYEVQKLFVKQQQLEALHDAQRVRLEEIFTLKTKMNDEIKSMMRKFVARKLKKLTDGDTPSSSRRGSSEFTPAQLNAILASSGAGSSGGAGSGFATSSQASPPNILILSSLAGGSNASGGPGGGASPNAHSPRFFGDLISNSPISSGNPLASGSSSQAYATPYIGKITGTSALAAGDWWSQFSDLGIDALSPPTEYSFAPMEKFHRAVELSEWKQSEALAVLSRDLALAETHKTESAELFERQAHELDVVRVSFETHYARSRQTFVSERLQRASRYELELLDLKYAYLKRQVSKADEELAMNEIRELESQREIDRSTAFSNFEFYKTHLLQLGGIISYTIMPPGPLARPEMWNFLAPTTTSSNAQNPSPGEYRGSPQTARAASNWTAPIITQAWTSPSQSGSGMTPSSSAHSLTGTYSPSRSSLDS